MPKRTGSGKRFPVGFLALFFFFVAVAGLVYFQTDLFRTASSERGLSGLVSVRGSVSLEQLALSEQEIGVINQAVAKYRDTFSKVDLIVDTVGRVDKITPDTILVFAVELQTNGDLVVKSWSRKVPRGKMVSQLVGYMGKAASEYKEFKRFPDVKQNFKTLYI
jgi:cell division protein FtsI/penicillin-binding protein 2